MRGRVNTDLYSGISLNANTDQFEVSGGNVVAGDFVQYKYAGAEAKYFGESKVLASRKICGNYFLTQAGALYKFSGDDISLVDSVPATCVIMDKMDDNHFVLTTSTGHWYFVTVDTTTDRLVIEAEYDNQTLANGDIHVVGANRNKILSMKITQVEPGSTSTGSYHFQAEFIVIDASDLDNLTILNHDIVQGSSFGKSNYRSSGSSYYYTPSPGTAVGIVNNLYPIFQMTSSSGSGSSISYRYYYTKVEFDDVNNTLINVDGELGEVMPSYGFSDRRNMINGGAHNGRFFFHIHETNHPYLLVYDLLNMTCSHSSQVSSVNNDIMTIPGSGSSSGTYCISEFDEDGIFYLASGVMWSTSYNAISRCKINITGGFELVAPKITNSADDTDVGYPMNNGNKSFLMWGNTSRGNYYYKNVLDTNGSLVFGEPSDIVEPYDGTNPKMLLGVAAQSGSSGDTIDVYVPLANT